jgi:hypothetical protein
MFKHQIFDDTFEPSWKEFDDAFRQELLDEFRALGSLHRISSDRGTVNTEYGRRFYQALERAVEKSQLIPKLKAALIIPLPSNFDDLKVVFDLHTLYRLHAFFLLVLYVHEYPMRAFFSGRDRKLPLNTITLEFHQALSDPLPTAVNYELDYISQDGWLRLATEYGAVTDLQSVGRPQHYWTDLRWVWHFDFLG